MKTFERVLIGGRRTTAEANEFHRDSADRRQVASEATSDGGRPQ